VRFQLDQALPGSVAEVLAAFTDPAFLTSVGDLGKVGAPEVLDQSRDGDTVRQHVRYRFTAELSHAVTSVIDRDKLVFVDEHVYDLKAATATFQIVPEHYAERLRCSGIERFHQISDGANRRIEAELTVKWPIVGGLVERAIVSGLKEHLADEAELMTAWLTRG
jgi:hypothetical protein